MTHDHEIKAILASLELDDHGIADAWRSLAVKGKGLHRVAHGNRHRLPREPDREFRETFDLLVDVLVVVLDKAEGTYTTVLSHLDEIADAVPTSAALADIKAHLASGATALGPFFERLPSGWLVPLRDNDLFSDPPEVRFHEDGSFSFPVWPQANFLVRVAPEVPREVAETVESVPSTENENVHLAFLDAALRMPPEFGA